MFAIVLLLLAQEPSLDSCTKDSDCVISVVECCAGCCGPSPYPTSKAADAEKRQRCMVTECAKPAKCTVQCESPISPEAYVAKCEKKVCVAKMKK